MNKIQFIILCLFSFSLKAQITDSQEIDFRVSLPEVSLLNIAPEHSTLLLNFEQTQSAGQKIFFIPRSQNQLWINYTCSLAPGKPTKNISAQIISGSVPDGLSLALKTSEYSGSGKGLFGSAVSTVTLQSYPQVIISNIGGSYTNKGVNNGHKMEYILEISNYRLLDYDKSNTLTILYTLSDN